MAGCIQLLSLVLMVCGLNTMEALNYYVGVGISDATGPAADINMMGFAEAGQTTHGIHLRQYARAFVIAESRDGPRIAFVNLDAGWADTNVKREAVKKLQSKLGSHVYTERNLCVSGTHTHSGVGGYSQYVLFSVTTLGFNKQTFNALVDAIVQSVLNAHNSLQKADIYINSGELLDSNINRSPSAYLRNPAAERAKYKYDVDKTMTVLKFVGKNNKDIGMLSWFAVHGTSMNKTNEMISADNKGVASQLFEKAMNPNDLPGKGDFVAAFAQGNLGDVSPNTKGPRCLDTGRPCDTKHSTCNGKSHNCVAFGPGKDMFESTYIIGTNQYNKAMELYKSATVKLSGPVDFRHSYADMTDQTVQLDDGSRVFTCKPAMGYSFAAGTTDGPGSFSFKQGSTSGNDFWNFVRNLIHTPSHHLVKCQEPKPILLPTGELSFPYKWQPEIVDIQLLRIGQFIVIAVPGEFTTMSGRRLRDTVQQTAVQKGMPADTSVVIAGLSNEYSDYITTFEEYQEQRYEGASTIYGPHTLSAYLQLYKKLAVHLATNKPSPAGPNPPNLLSKQMSFQPGVILDAHPIGDDFGEVLSNAHSSYSKGSTVTVKFQSANPRNNLRTNGTFLTVEHKVHSDWKVVCTDDCWETKFEWIRTNVVLGFSEARIKWHIPKDTPSGDYRIRHFGTYKSLFGKFNDFKGTSKTFSVN